MAHQTAKRLLLVVGALEVTIAILFVVPIAAGFDIHDHPQLPSLTAMTGMAPATSRPAAPELPTNPQLEAALIKQVQPGGRIRRTPHFLLVHNSDDATVAPLVSRIEATYAAISRFADMADLSAAPLKQRMTVFFFRDFAGYSEFLASVGIKYSANVAGIYVPSLNAAVFYDAADSQRLKKLLAQLDAARRDAQNGESSGSRNSKSFAKVRAIQRRIDELQDQINAQVIQHEIAHEVLYNLEIHNPIRSANPRWLTEGLAMLFEVPPGAAGSGIGTVNQYRLKQWLKAAEKKELPDLRSVMTDPGLLRPSNPEFGAAYPQAWALAHFLHRTRRKELARYMSDIRARRESRPCTADEELALFEKAFGPLDDKFIQNLERYIKKLPPKRAPATSR